VVPRTAQDKWKYSFDAAAVLKAKLYFVMSPHRDHVRIEPTESSLDRKHLVIWRSGPQSLHPRALQRPDQQNFDYALSWFGDAPPESLGMADSRARFVDVRKGGKWVGLEQTLKRHWDIVSRYDYVWLPDDDLLCEPETVSLLFTICGQLRAELAQPALTTDSFFSHPITLQHSAFQVRFTNFVEIMAPVLSVPMLERVLPTVRGSASGFGLDALWPRMSELGRVAIVDEAPVRHTRPVGGPNHAVAMRQGVAPMQELRAVVARHLIDEPWDVHLNYGGLLQSGDGVCIGDAAADIERMLALLIESCAQLPLGAMQFTRYLSDHLRYWSAGADGSARYPRSLLGALLAEHHRDLGLRFEATRPCPA
jgi:hypothetical protein